ncbi:AbrB/MazE/SpoVT family DNA-binding domain-containing protein [Deinococcus aestuarii]|uniref:AbrB/MazE/SpoVT family DNA-binding domain-containing protein n=1 Tax=Deinococcus aestuarii TaxID=2774531 RepID=UPI001C0E27FA|nr:AbrB/MazE/SpoVT family DNA-binding domain-containing protein [Deinococcus aestuarii]
MRSTVTSKGQTTIPKAIRERLHLDAGAEIDWHVEGETIVVRLARPADNPFAAFLGVFPLPDGQTTAEIVKQVRGERDVFLQGGPGARVVSLQDFLTVPE